MENKESPDFHAPGLRLIATNMAKTEDNTKRDF